MLKATRVSLIHSLWKRYRDNNPQMQIIESKLKQKGLSKLFLDHFAVIDLPGPHSGIPQLQQIFSTLGFVTQGQDYLPEKQNDFLWLADVDSITSSAHDTLPQVVVADFRLDEMPHEIKTIIEKYAKHAAPLLLEDIAALANQTNAGDETAANALCKKLVNYFAGRDWPLPTTKEFYQVHEFNELLAWVLVFGRQPNHFTLSIHLLNHFSSLENFHEFITDETHLALNREGAIIKGGQEKGIAQSSTIGTPQTIALADGNVELPLGFVEFVWRYSQKTATPTLWSDYFTGFIAQHADRVIESLYVSN